MSTDVTPGPVIIVGGGPVGMAAALELARFRVPSVVIERHTSTAWHPKARVISTRSMEIARGWGSAIHQRLKNIDMADDWKDRIRFVESIVGRHPAQIATPGFVGPGRDVSPSSSILSSQDLLEQVLYDGGLASDLIDLRFGHAAGRVLHGGSKGDRSVAIEIENITTGNKEVLEGAALLAADGVDSPIRSQLGIELDGEKNLYSYINCYFRADIERYVDNRRAAIFFYANGTSTGALMPLDSKGRWLSQISVDFDEPRNQAADERQCIEAVRAAVGVDDLPIEVLSIGRWRFRATTAARFVSGRVMVIGDAAHQLPPTGGLGLNSGFRGVQNAMWKLAFVINGHAGEDLLETYDVEHRPVTRWAADQCLQNERDNRAVRSAMMSSGDGRIDLPDIDLANHRYGKHFGIELGSYYTSTAVIADGTAPPNVPDAYKDYRPSARPGHRAPHVWLGREGRLSTLDLFGPGFTLLTGQDGDWTAIADAAAKRLAVPLGCYVVGRAGLEDQDGAFLAAYGLNPDGAVLVRPDGYVAWRKSSRLEPTDPAFIDALASILSRPA
ncbi:FAD-dependent monooxygenase [Bradyrhizobium sp. Cp5.3]|uniref:FAD-dependent monooxygenase n=1 Tax=Bradyrhizobium sp. Cp5.3 TaxID=443598 RepID=UPI0003FD28C9|nr:FAD-dependent monooxygenase [Bradyrhizobium sp. Cp5.3]